MYNLKLAVLDESFYVEHPDTNEYMFTALDLERTITIKDNRLYLFDGFIVMEYAFTIINVILEKDRGIVTCYDRDLQISFEFKITDLKDGD